MLYYSLSVISKKKDKIIYESDLLLSTLNIKFFDVLWNMIFSNIIKYISFSLRYYCISINDLSNVANLSFTEGRMNNNIVDLTKDDVLEILYAVW